MVSPELMCKHRRDGARKHAMECRRLKDVCFRAGSASFSRRAFHANSSSACFTVPSIASPCTRPSNLPHSLPSGRVAVMCKRSPSTVPSSFNSFKVPVSLLPSVFSSTRAAANSSPNRTRCRFHRPVTSAAQANTGRNNKSIVLVMQVIRCRTQIVPRERLKAGAEACVKTLEMAQISNQAEKRGRPFGHCMSVGQHSSFPIRGMPVRRGCWRTWALKRWPPPARAMPSLPGSATTRLTAPDDGARVCRSCHPRSAL